MALSNLHAGQNSRLGLERIPRRVESFVRGAIGCLGVGLLMSTLIIGAASATTSLPMRLRSVAKMAGTAFCGTVDSLSYGREGGVVVTHIHFSNVRVAKGRVIGTTFSLTQWGGILDSQEYGVDEAPHFDMGKRYVVFVSADRGSPKNLFLPIIGLNQGYFPLERDPSVGREVVHDWKWRPLVAVSGNHIVVLAERRGEDSTGPQRRSTTDSLGGWSEPGDVSREPVVEVRHWSADSGQRVSEDEFLNAVRRLATLK